MQVPNVPVKMHFRRGITLMEVLISIGIIAIGLTSVMSLIPAGKSEAGKAVVYDRASTMAMNGLADAITFGLTRPDSIIATSSTVATIVFDANASLITAPATVAAVATAGSLKSSGVLSALPPTDNTPVGPVIQKLFLQGRDDVIYNRPGTGDELPTNSFLNGIRGFEGRMTSLIALTEADTGSPPLSPGDLATLSVVVFHSRDAATPIVTGTISTAGLVNLTPPDGRTLKSIIRPGTVLYYVDTARNRLRFAQLSMAAVDTNSIDAYVTFSGRPIPSPVPPAANIPVYILVDSVGLAEQTVSLEGPGAFGQ
jgi:type II secretory pathway pseudopilin PulG